MAATRPGRAGPARDFGGLPSGAGGFCARRAARQVSRATCASHLHSPSLSGGPDRSPGPAVRCEACAARRLVRCAPWPQGVRRSVPW
jgi:hypothetical protein